MQRKSKRNSTPARSTSSSGTNNGMPTSTATRTRASSSWSKGEVGGKATPLLRFNCFDVERSYIYAPEGKNRICRIDPIADGNPIGWTMRQLRDRLPQMLDAAGLRRNCRGRGSGIGWRRLLGDLEHAARDTFTNQRGNGQAQPGHRHVRGRGDPLRARDADLARRRRPRNPRALGPRRPARRSLHRGDRDPRLRLLP